MKTNALLAELLAAVLPLAACSDGGRYGAGPLASATSRAYAANGPLDPLDTATQTVPRHGYGYGFPWGDRYQQPYQRIVAPQPAPRPDTAREYSR